MKDANGVFSPMICLDILEIGKVEAMTYASVLEHYGCGCDVHGYDRVVRDVISVCTKEGFQIDSGIVLLAVPMSAYIAAARKDLNEKADGTVVFDGELDFAALVPDNCTIAEFLETSNTFISKVDKSNPAYTREMLMGWCVVSAVLKATASFPSFDGFMQKAFYVYHHVEKEAAEERARLR